MPNQPKIALAACFEATDAAFDRVLKQAESLMEPKDSAQAIPADILALLNSDSWVFAESPAMQAFA